MSNPGDALIHGPKRPASRAGRTMRTEVAIVGAGPAGVSVGCAFPMPTALTDECGSPNSPSRPRRHRQRPFAEHSLGLPLGLDRRRRFGPRAAPARLHMQVDA